jgi:hypothetical protein
MSMFMPALISLSMSMSININVNIIVNVAAYQALRSW